MHFNNNILSYNPIITLLRVPLANRKLTSVESAVKCCRKRDLQSYILHLYTQYCICIWMHLCIHVHTYSTLTQTHTHTAIISTVSTVSVYLCIYLSISIYTFLLGFRGPEQNTTKHYNITKYHKSILHIQTYRHIKTRGTHVQTR